MANVKAHHFDRNIEEVYKRNLPDQQNPGKFKKPRESFSLATKHWPGGERMLLGADPSGSPSVSKETAEKLVSALWSRTFGNDRRFRTVIEKETIRDFRRKTPVNQIRFINDMWNASTEEYEYDTPVTAMVDPMENKPTNKRSPLPTTWHQVGKAAFEKRLPGTPFKTTAIAFRVDGSSQGDIARIKRDGVTQQRANDAFMYNVRGLNVRGTVIGNSTKARFWTANHDTFNETAVCVSRNFFGATGFPLRETVHKPNEFALLWAFDVREMKGFDCEKKQLELGATNWRPGEKAFEKIPKERVLGYVSIQRNGGSPISGWEFTIPNGAKWIFHNKPSAEVKKYLEDELEVWRRPKFGLQNPVSIPVDYDFSSG